MLFTLNDLILYGNGQGRPEKSTGPPSPASASRRLMMTAIAASSLPSDEGLLVGDSRTASSIIPITRLSDAGKVTTLPPLLQLKKFDNLYK